MINGVMHIVAAVLFAVVSLNEGTNIIWMGIAGIYLITGVINLAAHSIRVKKIEKAAKKAEQAAASKPAEKIEKTEKTEITTVTGE